ncbi:hypothetical protein [Flavobacterium fluviatile]|uniref:hypothetical protein n=1 Tax=Flavobacterium fluviatile TaxID=1862387 RepID=UPI0013D66106|nr:hypothetical protein [Flavobacterium fluviatile]
MNKWIGKIKEYWKDPVWSKVIAAGIIFILGTIYAIIQSIVSKISFLDIPESIYGIIKKVITLPLWILLLFSAAFLIFTLKPIVSFSKELIDKIRKPKIVNQKEKIPNATENSTVLFSYRMAKAFPGVRDLVWFNEPCEAKKRLLLLLTKPLRFKNGSFECESDPIWWFRGGSSLYIQKFEKLRNNKVLMNIDQLKIKRIASYHGNSYYRDFVYVETTGEEQTGIYKMTLDEIKRQIEYFGYSREEYGLIKYFWFWRKPISREHYDDGATIIRGKVVNADDAELRVRYISDYNFIIAAKGSPYNSAKFDKESKRYLNGILKGEIGV